MINARSCHAILLLLAVSFGTVASAHAGDHGVRFKATLVWGTNDAEPDDSKLKPVPPRVAQKLAKLPFKWKHYYAVGECKEFSVPEGKWEKVRMSDDCEIVVKAIDGEKVELSLRGKGKPVGKVTQKLPKGCMLVTGGDAENMTAWFVVLRRAE